MWFRLAIIFIFLIFAFPRPSTADTSTSEDPAWQNLLAALIPNFGSALNATDHNPCWPQRVQQALIKLPASAVKDIGPVGVPMLGSTSSTQYVLRATRTADTNTGVTTGVAIEAAAVGGRGTGWLSWQPQQAQLQLQRWELPAPLQGVFNMTGNGIPVSACDWQGQGRYDVQNLLVPGIDLPKLAHTLGSANPAPALINKTYQHGSTVFPTISGQLQWQGNLLGLEPSQATFAGGSLQYQGWLDVVAQTVVLELILYFNTIPAAPPVTVRVDGPLLQPMVDLQDGPMRQYLLSKHVQRALQ